MELHSSIRRVYLNLSVNESGQIMAESDSIEVVEDESEVSKSNEMEFLQYMNRIYCKEYVESDVVTCSRNGPSSYKVYVDSEACFELKVVFASARKQGTNAFLDYLDDIKHFISLRGCANVSEFRGVVLDDTRRQCLYPWNFSLDLRPPGLRPFPCRSEKFGHGSWSKLLLRYTPKA